MMMFKNNFVVLGGLFVAVYAQSQTLSGCHFHESLELVLRAPEDLSTDSASEQILLLTKWLRNTNYEGFNINILHPTHNNERTQPSIRQGNSWRCPRGGHRMSRPWHGTVRQSHQHIWMKVVTRTGFAWEERRSTRL